MPIKSSKVKTLYDALVADGADVGTEDEFKNWFFAKGEQGYKNRKTVFDAFKEDGADVGKDYEEFAGLLGLQAAPRQGYKPSASEMADFQSTIDTVGRVAANPTQSYDRKVGLMQKRQGLHVPQRINLGESNNLTPTEQHFNIETGEMEQRYVTGAGNEYDSKTIADMEQREIDKAQRDEKYKWTLPGQLEDAYAERDRLNAEIEEETKRIGYGSSSERSFAPQVPGSIPRQSAERLSDNRLQTLYAAQRQNEQRIVALEAERDDDGGTQFWRGFIDAAKNPATWTFGATDFLTMNQLMRIKSKVDKAAEEGKQPQLNSEEQQLMESTYLNNYAQSAFGENRGFMYRAGGISMQALPFVAEFMATGGFSAISQKGAELGVRAAESMALKGLSRTLVKNLGIVAGDVAAGWAMANTTGIFRTAGDVMQRNIGEVAIDENGNLGFKDGKSLGRSIYEAEVANTLEYYTEKLGEHLKLGKRLAKGAEKMGLSRLSKAVNYLSGNRWLEMGGIQDYPSEVVEEQANLLLNAALVGDNTFSGPDDPKSVINKNTQLDIWGGMLFSIGLMQAPRLAYSATSAAGYYAYKKNVDISDSNAAIVFGRDNWDMIKEQIDNCDNEKLPALLESIVNGSMKPEQKTATMNYAGNLIKMRGYNMGMMAGAKDEEESTKPETIASRTISQGYQAGRQAQLPDEMKMYVDEAEVARENLAQYGNEFANMVTSQDPLETLSYLMNNRNFFDDDQIAAAADFYQKSARANGVMDAAVDNVDIQLEQANAEVRTNTHQATGNVIMAKGDGDLDYYIIGGDVVTDEQGMTSLVGTGGAVVVKDPVTGEVSVKSPAELMIYSMQNADELIQQNETTLREQLMQQADDDITFGSPANEVFDMEDTVTLQDGNGGVIEGQVVQLPNSIDGVFVIQTTNGQALQMTADDMNRRIVAHNGQEVQRAGGNLAAEPQSTVEGATNMTGQEQPQQSGEQQANGETPTDNQGEQSNQPPSALSRIPVRTDANGQPVKNRKGKPVLDWHKVSVEDATAALLETTGGEMLMARDTATDLVKNAEAGLERIRKQKPKGDDPIEIAESRMEIRRQEQEQQAIIKQWKDVNKRIQQQMREESEARQAAIEAAKSEEQRQREAEEARKLKEKQNEIDRQRIREQIERDKERRNKEYTPLVEARKEMTGDDNALAILNDTEPRSLEEFVSSLLRPHSMLWQDASENEIGLQSELGLKRADMQRMMTLLGTKENGAKPFGRVVLDIYEGLTDAMKQQYTDEDVRQTLLNLFNEGSSTRMLHLTEENRIAEAREAFKESRRRAEEYEMEAWAEAYHLTPEERESFEEFMQQPPLEPEQEIINQIIAENEQNRNVQRVDQQPVTRTGTSGVEGSQGQVQRETETAGNGNAETAVTQGTQTATGEPPVSGNEVLGGASRREEVRELLRQIGASPVLADRMSDYDVQQLMAMVDEWDIINSEYGEVIQNQEKNLQSKNKDVRENAQKVVDEAQERANEAFVSIEQYIEGLNTKYGIENEEPFEGAIPTPAVDKPRYDANRKALVEAYRSGDTAAIQAAAQAIQQYVDEGLDASEDHTEIFDIAEEYDGNDPEMLADQYIIRTFWDRYLDDDVDKEYIRTGLKPEMREKDENNQDDSLAAVVSAARNGDKTAQEKLNSYGIKWEKKPVVRFVSQGEVDNILNGGSYKGRFGNGRVDVTNSTEATTASTAEYRITFKDELDWTLSDRLRMKNEELGDGYIMDGYSLDDVATIEKHNEDGTYTKVYDANSPITPSEQLKPTDSRDAEGNFVLTAYDITKPQGEKKRSKEDATLIDQSIFGEDGTLVPQTQPSYEGKAIGTTSTPEQIAQEEHKVDTNPTDAQKEAGNYQKGHIKIDGYDITIENPKGSIRSGVDANGNPWETQMHNTYGYVRGTEGFDGDHIDVFLSDNPTSGKVYVVDQVNEHGDFDEHKVMYGFASEEEARQAYLSNYSEGWQGLGNITEVSREEFKKWVESSHRKTKPFAEYKNVKKGKTAGKAADTVAKPKKEHKRIVSDDQMEELRKKLLEKFGNMNAGIDVERMLLGAMYAVGKIERGVTKFADYAREMVEEIGDSIRPYLKAFYNAVRDMPEAAEYRGLMDTPEYVEAFDVDNFDKQVKVPDAITKAQQVVKNTKAKRQVKKIQAEQPDLFAGMFDGLETEQTIKEAEQKPKSQPQQKPKTPKLRKATEADFEGNGHLTVYHEGRPHGVIAVIQSGEQISATQFSKPRIDTVMLANGQSVKFDELQVEDDVMLPRTAWWNDPNRPKSLTPQDYKTYMTDEAKAYFAQFESEDGKVNYTKWAHPNLAYITAAAWDGANIPVEELMQIPEIAGAEERVMAKAKLPKFRISKLEHRAFAERLLGDKHGSAVFENGKIKKVNGKEVFTGPVRKEKKAFVVVGRPAGGKSSVFANRLSHDNGARIVDSDIVKPWLSGYDDGYGAGYVQLSSADVASSALKKASDAGDNIVMPRIGGGSVMDEVMMLREKGYEVQIFYNEVSEETSIMRAASRFAQEGRYLSLQYLTNIGTKDSKSFRTFVGKKIGDYYEQTERERPSEQLVSSSDVLAGRGSQSGNQDEDLQRGDFGRGRGSDVSGLVSEGRGFERADQERAAGSFEEELIFSYAEWKSNDVPFGEKPKEIWNSKSGKLIPGTKEVKKQKNNDELHNVQSEQRLPGESSTGSQESGQESRGTGRTGTQLGSEQDRPERSGYERTVEPKGLAEKPQGTPNKNKRNNQGKRGEDYAPTSLKARFNANVEAIRLMRQLMDEGVEATTKEEMAVLRQYSGWGGMGTFFNDESSAENKLLHELLSEEEYNDAAMSINSAYYTPATVIDTLWDIAKALGFKGGNVLEGSAGIGNIIGQMPKEMSRRSDIEAVEIDKISGNILKLLYPDAKVHIQGFQDTMIRNGSVDLAITNVPFVTGLSVIDKVDKDLSRKFTNIHDFCIAKNTRKLREGGIGIFITSRGTLDSSTELRQWITDQGQTDVIGAFRLNNKTFGGTSVTSDIIVVRKRAAGEPASPVAIDVSTATPMRVGTYTDKYGDEHQVSMTVNDYFREHPEMMAGEMAFGYEKGETFRPGSYGLYPVDGKDQQKMLKQLVKKMEEESQYLESLNELISKTEKKPVTNQLTEEKEGRMLIDGNGRLCVSQYGEAVPLNLNAQKVKGYSKEQCFKDYQAVQKAVDDVLQQQLNDPDDAALKPKLDALNKVYDTFVKRYGYLHKNTAISFLRNDIDFQSFLALENYSETKDIKGKVTVTVKKAPLFKERVLGFKTEPKPKTVKDAVISSMFRSNGIDLEWIAKKLNEVAAPPNGDQWTTDDVRKEILVSRLGFEDPSTGQLEIRYKYLSGNVREKLAIAEEYNSSGETAGRYAANVEELRKVVPMDIPAHLIDFSLGSSWIPMELYHEYLKENYDLTDVKLSHIEGMWVLNPQYRFHNEKNRTAGVYSEKFRETIYGHQLVAAALNNRPVKVAKQVTEGYGQSKTTRTVVDQAATQSCAVRVDEIKDEFRQWVKKKMQDDAELAERIEKIYNDKFNALVPMQIDDEFLPEHFEGANMKITLRQHQKRGALRDLTSPTMLAHEVGTGKSFTLLTTAMEMRRLGTAKKPMIVVQNATVAQMTADVKLLYPNAKVLSLSEKDRSAEGRRAFYAKIKYNDWDIIIIPQSTLNMIPDSPERELQFIQEKIDEKKHVIEAAQAAGVEGRELDRLKRELEKIEQEYGDVFLDNDPANLAGKTSERTKGKKKDAKRDAASLDKAKTRAQKMLDRQTDDVQYFDDLGVDAILVDEAHEYKHLGFQTSIGSGIKGIDPSYSKKCAGLYNKTRSVFERVGWKNVIFATGTPISNTAAEIWTFMRYLMPVGVMKANDIYYFDDFVHNFGNISQSLEFQTNGKFKEVTRFAAYFNKPELIRIWTQVADIVRTEDTTVQDKIPEKEGGKDQDVFLPQSPSLVSIMAAVRAELERFEKMDGKQKKENSHIPLTMYGIAKRAAIDPRLVNPDATDEPLSKTNAAVKEIVKDLKATKDYKGTVAVFCDNQNRKGADGSIEFNIFEDMKAKLVAQGVPENQIAIIKSGMSITAKQKIFDAVNAGDIRVVLGSTQTLGTGVNMQERLHLLIHMDAPDRPMDYTQRNGRIERQGNLHKEWGKPIRILRFGVEDSLDVTAYQRLKTKSGFIDSIMHGKQSLVNNQVDRTVEEEEEGLFDNPVAILSGSQYALKRNQAERELRKYLGKKAQWEADQVYVANTLRRNKGIVEDAETQIGQERKMLEYIKSLFPDGKVKTITIQGIKVKADNAEQLSKVMKEKVNDPVNAIVKRNRENAIYNDEIIPITIELDGHAINFEVSVERESVYDNGRMRTVIHKYVTYKSADLREERQTKSTSSVRDMLDEILDEVVTGRDYQDRIDALQQKIGRTNAETEQLQQRVGMEFLFGKELEQAEKQVEEYTELMKKEMEEKEKKYAAQQTEAVDLSKAESEDDTLYSADEDWDELTPHLQRVKDALDAKYPADSWIAFYPEQVKSATDNVGTYYPTNTDIRYRDAERFRDGQTFPIRRTEAHSSYDVIGRNRTYSTDLMPDEYATEQALLNAIRNQYPEYFATIEDGQLRMESWQHVMAAYSNAVTESQRTVKDKGKKSYAERKIRNAVNAVKSLADLMGLDVEVLNTTEGLTDKKARSKGFFNPKTGKITLVLPNNVNQNDLIKTLLHEGVAHFGLRKMFGPHFATFLDNVYNNVSPEIKRRIDAAMKKNKWSHHTATEEYLARLAERTDFDNATKQGWWQKIKQFFVKMLAEAGLVMGDPLTDNELRYILWRSYDNLLHPDSRRSIFDKAKEITMQQRLGINRYVRERERLQRTGKIDTSRIVAESVSLHAVADRLIEDAMNSKQVNRKDEQSFSTRVTLLPDTEVEYAYNKLNDMMRDEEGLDLDEHFEKTRLGWLKAHGTEGLGKATSADLQAAIDKYGAAVSVRWDLLDRLEKINFRRMSEARGTTANEEMLNRDMEGMSSQDLLLSLSQKEGNERNETINELIRRVRTGEAKIVRMGQEVELDRESDAQIAGTIIAGWEQLRLSESSDDLLGSVVQSSSSVEGRPYTSGEDITPDFKLALISWARATGHYISEEQIKEQSPEKHLFGSGAESNVYRTKDGEKVIKFINAEDTYYQNPLLKKMDGIALFNSSGFIKPITVLGYSIDERNHLRVVVEQDYVDGVTVEEIFDDEPLSRAFDYIDAYLEEVLGLESYEDEDGNPYHMKDGIIYKDINTGNMVVDRNNNRHIIDCYVSRPEDDYVERAEGFSIEDNELNQEIQAMKEADEMGLLYRSDEDAWTDDVAQEVYERAVAKDAVKMQEAWQDSMVSLKIIQDAIARETGNRATGAENAYLFENRMHGRAKNMTEQYDWQYYRPMLKTFNDFCKTHGYTHAQGMDYLISKSGLERNMYYAMQAAVKDKLAEEAKTLREQLEKEYARKNISEEEYKTRRDEIAERERTGVDDVIKEIKERLVWQKAKEDYDAGDISFQELLRRREDIIKSVAPKYQEYAHDYSGLTETFAKEFYDDAQYIKKKAQRAIDPVERRTLWSQYDKAMNEAYKIAYEYALDAVFSGENGEGGAVAREMWKAINAATEETLKHSYESGMMERDIYYKVRDMFDYYIPLRGWEEDKAADVYTYMGKDNVFSPAFKKAWGRTSKAENPLAYIGNIAVSTILVGHRNLMKQHFLNYVMNNPTSLVSISESWYENIGTDEEPMWILRSADTAGKSSDEIAQIVNDFNEEMRQKQADGLAMPVRGRLRLDVHATSGQKSEHVVEVQRAGHTYQLYINGDPKAAQALNGTAAKAVSRISDTWLGKKITGINRSMAEFFTSKNPAFVVSNLSRDLNMAGASVAVNEGPEYNARFIANVARVLTPRVAVGDVGKKGLLGLVGKGRGVTGLMPELMAKWKKGKLDVRNETERLFKEFMDEGGETGFVNMLSVDSFKEKMQKEIGQMNGSSLFGSTKSSRTVKEASVHKGLRLLGETFEFYNRCAEDATRFIVYVTSRQMGKTLEESIADAKDVTLNFNRKGTGAKGNAEIRDLFIFVNPAIQALANMYRMAKGHPLKFGAVTATFVAGGALIPVINQWLLNMFGDDDDKQAYWNLPPWVRKNNLVFWIPFTKNFVTIPLAQEFRVFYGVGEMMSSAIMDHHVDNMGLEIFSSVADLVPINPTGNGGNLMVDFAPTMVQPLMQVGENIDFTGKPIWRENQGNKYAPMYTKTYITTPKWMVKVSEAINSSTGGNEGKKGVVEKYMPFWGDYVNNPAVWNHLLQGYLGGMYNTIAKTTDVVVTAAQGELPKIYQTPVINRFLNRPVERDNAGALGEDYYHLTEKRNELKYMLRVWQKKAADGEEGAQEHVDEILSSNEWKRAEVVTHYERIMKDLKAGERAATDKEDKAQIKESIGLYKQQMMEELNALDEGKESLEAAVEAYDKAKTYAEKNKLRTRIERLMSSESRSGRSSSEDEVKKALSYISDEDKESLNTNESYLSVATAENVRDDARIKAEKAKIKPYSDEYKKMVDEGRHSDAAEYRQKHLKYFIAKERLDQLSRAMNANKKLLGKGQDKAIKKLIDNNRRDMIQVVEEMDKN